MAADWSIYMIRAQKTIDLLANPIAYSNMADEEKFAPVQQEIRNVTITDAGNTSARNGYATKWDIIEDASIIGLIPHGENAFAISKTGTVSYVEPNGTIATLEGTMTVHSRPRGGFHGTTLIVVAGGAPVTMTPLEVSELVLVPDTITNRSNRPPAARFISRIASYSIMSGYDATEVRYSVPNNPLDWNGPGSGFFNVREDGGRIRHQIDLNGKLFFFKDKQTEVWGLSSAPGPFSTRQGLWIEKGCGADDSVVKTNNTLYWYGNDGDFYVLAGGISQSISDPIRASLDELHHPELIYGIDFTKEKVIRWFAPYEGKCFTYFYKKNRWTEDNRWQSGIWTRLPINSYMELKGEQYVGDYRLTGKIFNWSKEHKDDDGTPIRGYRKFRVRPSVNWHKARFNNLRLRVKKGYDATGNLVIRWRGDQGAWSKERKIDLGDLGNRNPYIDIKNMGVAREMEYEIVHTDSIDYKLMGAKLTYRELGN
jgi:hypothetical protein